MTRRSVVLILGAILLAWTGLTFQPARHFEFVNYDDYDEVVENPLLHPPTTAHLGEIWSGPHLEMYSPLSYSAWWTLTHESNDPSAFHLLNIALHLACVALVYSILMTCVKSPTAAFGGAAIFALHPVQVESVAWVSEMGNLLAGALSLGALRLYLAFRTAPAKHRWWYYALGLTVFVLALFAKATAVVVPLMAVILDLGFMRTPPRRRAIGAILPWFVAAGIFGWIAHVSQQAGGLRLWDRPVIAIDALAFYFGKLFWPVGLTIDYGRTSARILMSGLWVGNLAVVLVMCVILWVLWKNFRGVALGAILMLAGLLPVLGFVPFGLQEYSTVADHLFYLGMLGPALAGGVMLAAAPKWLAPPVAVALTLGLALLSARQLMVWQDTGTLVARALAIDPGSAIGNGIVGAEFNREGKPDEAVPHFSAAIARDPTSAEYRFNLANALFNMHEYEKSIDEYHAAIALFHRPSWKAMNNLGVAYARLGRRDEAIKWFREALKIDPGNDGALKNLRILSGGVPTR